MIHMILCETGSAQEHHVQSLSLILINGLQLKQYSKEKRKKNGPKALI